MCKHLDASIECKPVRMINPSTLEESVQQLPMILPHNLCLALWRRGETIFRRCLFGRMSDNDIKAYWDHQKQHSDWFCGHPAYKWRNWARMASVGSYGDEVQAYRNSECGVVSVLGWSSELHFNDDPLLRYFAITIWSEHHESRNTYNDAIGHVVESFRKLMEQTWPWSDKGYMVFFSFAQGDLKWVSERMGGIHNFRRNEFCSRCKCVKTDPDVFATLPYFPSNHEHFGRQDFTPAQLANFSPLFTLPLTMERVQHDVAHSQLLGTGKTSNGASMWSLVSFSLQLSNWCRGHGIYIFVVKLVIVKVQPSFTCVKLTILDQWHHLENTKRD